MRSLKDLVEVVIATVYLTVLLSGLPFILSADTDRFCNGTSIIRLDTLCKPCALNAHITCPNGAVQLTSGRGKKDCSYDQKIGTQIVTLDGCRHQCEKEIDVPSCCDGHWGNQCNECFGGANNPCFGKGICDDGYEGTGICLCLSEYNGTACELCSNQRMYGQNCTSECRCVNGTCNNGPDGDGSCACYPGFKGRLCDQEIIGCENKTCMENSFCVEKGDNTSCICDDGFEKTDTVYCDPIDACLSSPCDEAGLCEATGPNLYQCTCKSDYRGDGHYCLPINNCLENDGGCVTNSSFCVSLGPRKHNCECFSGYEDYQPDYGCSMIDECIRGVNLCHKKASCKTLQPGQVECLCPPDYVGDGKVCYGTILQQLDEINRNYSDPLISDSLHTVIMVLKNMFSDILSSHGPFTLFVPVDRGFKNILRNTALTALMKDEDRIRQIIYQHLIVGQLTMNDLTNDTIFYTLQGSSAELQARGNSFRFKLHGRRDKTKILRSDLVASNGVIHIVNSLLTSQPDQMGNTSKNLFDLINSEGRHNRFVGLIRAARIESWLTSQNLTIFTPSNGALSSLPEGTLDYLQSPKGKDKLISLLQTHIFEGVIRAADLINLNRIKSLEGSYVTVKISRVGQILLNDDAGISQTNIPGQNGIYHHIESVLLPEGVNSLLPNRCDKSISRVVKGSCGPCRGLLKCPGSTDTVMNETVYGCNYWVKAGSRYISLKGCARLCNRTFVTPQCCPDFYGRDCKPCPGAFLQICSGHGKCMDGYSFDGKCLCDVAFTGDACEECSDKQVFGTNCSEKCTCLFGNCDSGPKGSGKCKVGTCADGYWGENCEIKESVCGRKAMACHAHSVCVKDANKATCVCKPGYEGNGVSCKEINPCLLPDRGGCHPQATCKKTGPGMHHCSCDDGWVGDGVYFCYRSTPCSSSSPCDSHASCKPVDAGQYVCVCDNGYHGNGTFCTSTNPCSVNNGGCHPKANCSAEDMEPPQCICPENYGGNGFSCYSTIAVELAELSVLSKLKTLFDRIEEEDDVLSGFNNSYTLFAPFNPAIERFQVTVPENFWLIEGNLLTFQGYHILPGSFSISQLKQLTELMSKVNTLANGLSVNVSVTGSNEVFVNDAKIMEANIPAINGYIHIIDKVLEPFPISIDQPSVTDFFSKHPEFSLFAKALKVCGLLEMIDNLEEYTLFALNNKYIEANNITMSTKFLSLFIVPKLLMSATITTGQTENTILGARDQIQFIKDNGKLYANEMLITRLDMPTEAGVVHEVDGEIRSSHRHCDVKMRQSTYGTCISCDTSPDKSTCPLGYDQSEGILIKSSCTFSAAGIGGSAATYLGCQTWCIKITYVTACCSGYYGIDCKECPGGADNPCSNHGNCLDDGSCQCQLGWTGNNCSVVAETTPCETDNGGCGDHADCQELDGVVNCVCKPGFIQINGTECREPCSYYNGGCHHNADCHYQDNSVSCVCPSGYQGDGKQTCDEVDVDICKSEKGPCNLDKFCTHISMLDDSSTDNTLMCTCREDYVGDMQGTFCVNRSLFEALKTIPIAQSFYQSLTNSSWYKERKDLIRQLQDVNSKITIFLPVNSSFNSYQLTTEDLKNHIINETVNVEHQWWYDNGNTFLTEAGQIVVIRDRSGFNVNGVSVLQRNLKTVNGLIHVIRQPLWVNTPNSTETPYVNTTDVGIVGKTSQSGVSFVGPVVGAVGGAFLLIIIILLSLWIWKGRATGFLGFKKRFNRKGSDTTLSLARMQSEEEDQEDDMSSLQYPPVKKYKNPLYNVKDDYDNLQDD